MSATNTVTDVKLMRGVLLVALGIALYSAYCLAAAPRVREQAAQVQTMTCDVTAPVTTLTWFSPGRPITA